MFVFVLDTSVFSYPVFTRLDLFNVEDIFAHSCYLDKISHTKAPEKDTLLFSKSPSTIGKPQ